MRSKVIQVMDEVSLGLTNYDAVRRVIRTAVDDAGLLPYLQEDYHHQYQTKKKTAGRHGSGSGVTIADSAWPSKKARSSRGDGIRRILYYDSEDQETMSEDPKGGIETLDDDDDDNDDGNARESPWFRLSASTTAAHKHRYSAEETDVIDESQIPVVVQVAMEAVIDYIAEILTPTLIIHQLTEAIQDTLHQISRLRALQYPLTDSEQADETTSNTDFDINALSSQSLSQVRGGRDHHGVDLLSDDWVWAFSFAGDGDSGHDGDGETGSDSRGEDEDLWDQDMAINEWDTTGRLFDDFSDADEDDTDAFSSTTNSKESEVDTTGVDDDNVNDGLETYPFSIGIHEGHEPYADEDEDDETLDSGEDYERVRFSRSRGIAKQALFSRFHKRSSVPSDSDNLDSTVEPESQAAQTGLVTTSATHASSKGMDVLSKRRDDAGTFLSRSRRPTFAPDPRLENLLTQLIEPLLTAFIDEEFPASCKRVQGELMDGIIWSLDEGELNGSQWESERDQLALLAELEY
ncbi:hypothetical protein BGX28_008272 [Mortierella sp. GBA30]|nr:hypothetical protein BGX28_008272 [Mortierella sp. GBA30]